MKQHYPLKAFLIYLHCWAKLVSDYVVLHVVILQQMEFQNLMGHSALYQSVLPSKKYFQSRVVFHIQVIHFMLFPFEIILLYNLVRLRCSLILSKIKVGHEETMMNICELRQFWWEFHYLLLVLFVLIYEWIFLIKCLS